MLQRLPALSWRYKSFKSNFNSIAVLQVQLWRPKPIECLSTNIIFGVKVNLFYSGHSFKIHVHKLCIWCRLFKRWIELCTVEMTIQQINIREPKRYPLDRALSSG